MINKVAFKLGLNARTPWLLPVLNKGRLRPSFFIAGFQKCGTTSLYDALMRHPDMVPGLLKENNQLTAPNDKIEEFLLSFPYRWSGKVTGDASHLPTWNPIGLDRIKKHFPDARVIVLMRDPVTRAYSHFNMDKRIGYISENLTFEQYIDMEIRLRESIGDPNDPYQVFEAMKFYGNKYGWALSRGVYHPYIRRMQELQLNMLPLFMEDMEKKSDLLWARICDFLQIKDTENLIEQKNKGSYETELSASTRERLMKFYAPHNKALSELLDQTLPWS